MSMTATLNLLIKPPKTETKEPQKHQKKKPDTEISLLQLCKNPKELQQVHALLIKTSLIRQKHAFGRLLLSLNEMGCLDYARKLFEKVEIRKNSFMYNTMMRGFLSCGDTREAFVVYVKMLSEAEECVLFPDEFTFTFVFSACSKFRGVFEGRQAHAHMLKCPVNFTTHSWNSLMDFYVKVGEDGVVVRRVFDRIASPDVVSFNCLIDGFVGAGDLDSAKRVFDEMPVRDVVSWTVMLVGYVNAGLLSEACRLFLIMPEKNLVSYSVMVGGFVQMGWYGQALDLFKEMQVAGIEIDEITVTTLLSACAKMGALDQGRWLHRYIGKNGINVDAHLSTALIDMYCKCGEIEIARKVFEETAKKKVFIWNAMLNGLAMHSLGGEAINLFHNMVDCGVDPNEITYITVLSACAHSGFVDVGFQIFNRMMINKNLTPSIDHYVCIVDLLGRAGLLDDAFHIIQSLPMKVDGNILRAILGACKSHGNIELGEQVGRVLIEMEPSNDTNYILLSNLHATGNRHEMAWKLRREMKDRGLAKTPGCSSIEINGEVHEFVTGDNSHYKKKGVYELLQVMVKHLTFNA